MKRIKSWLYVAAMLMIANQTIAESGSTWEPLIDNNLSQWVGGKNCKEGDFTVQDGVITVAKHKGWDVNLYTKKEYDNFHLKFDFKLTEKANNGIGIRTPKDTNAAWNGMEIQILDNPSYKNLKSYQYHGSVYGVIPARQGALKPVGEWNTEEIIADGTKIKVIVNGITIVDGDIAPSIKSKTTMDHKDHPGLGNKKGRIAILGHKSKVWFRNMEIKTLPSAKVSQTDDDGWESLFDGKNLDQWKMYNGGEVKGWIAEDGYLVALGKGGDLGGDVITKEQYDNFIFSVDWKIGKGANSGIMYHVVEGKMFGRAPYKTGPEYQIIDDENYFAMNRKGMINYNKYLGYTENLEQLFPSCRTGSDYQMHLADPEKKKMSPLGEWNNSKIVFDNGHVEHWLNGQKILEFEAWTSDWFKRRDAGKWGHMPEYGLSPIGHICLQDHGSKIWFKDLKIKRLPKKKPAPRALFNGKDLTGWKIFGAEKWYVDNDGLLVCESGPKKKYGYLGTERYYKDFELNLEFNQVSNGNSGVFIRSTVKGTKVTGWQVEVAPENQGTSGIYESYGRGWLSKIPKDKESVLKVGQWNKMRIRVVGDRVTTWLNGVQMTDLKDEKIGKAVGRIALQIHDGGGVKVQWRNIIIQEL